MRLDRDSFERFDTERRTYFPADLNRVPAHVSLFHALPGSEFAPIDRELATVAGRTSIFEVEVVRLRNLGRGVAYELESSPLADVHHQLATSFAQWLTAQDRQKFKPHLTIQNKVTAEEAQATLLQLQLSFAPFTVQGAGMCLWRYCSGFWELEKSYKFKAN